MSYGSPAASRPASWSLAAMLASLAMLGPFSIDAYLPAFPMIARELNASPLQMQQTMSGYLFAYALMMLWHGALSDALGRRPVVLAGLAVYAAASLGCALAATIESLWLFRVLQGLSAGSGLVVGRAIVRDCYQGAEAQRQMSRITLVFGLAPAVAPIVGGQLATAYGWRSVFAGLLLVTAAMLAWAAHALPETLAPTNRQSLAPRRLLASYRAVFVRREFLLLALTLAFNFAGFFTYIAIAPAFLIGHLGLDSRSFAWLFVPLVCGLMLGAYVSGRVAERWPTRRTIATGYGVMFAGSLLNLAVSVALPPAIPWSVLPLMVFTVGSSMNMPSVTLLLLDLFPHHRGLVSSLQAFAQILIAAIHAGAIAPFLAQSLPLLASAMLASVLISYGLWFCYRRLPARDSRPSP